MSLALAFYNNNGIVMSADRRITTIVDDSSFPLTDNEQKIFLSTEGYGFAYVGSSKFRDRPTSYWMRRFIGEYSCKGLSVSQFLVKLCKTFYLLDKTKNVSIIGVGIENNKNQVYSIGSYEMNLADHAADGKCNIIFSGEKEIARNIIDMYPIDKSLFPISDMIDYVKHVTLTASNIQKFAQMQQTISKDCDILAITNKSSKWVATPPSEHFQS